MWRISARILKDGEELIWFLFGLRGKEKNQTRTIQMDGSLSFPRNHPFLDVIGQNDASRLGQAVSVVREERPENGNGLFMKQ